MSLLKGLIDCCSTKGPLMKHNVPVWMSTAHQCNCFLTYPSLPSSPLFPPVMLSGSRAFPECHHNTLHLHLHSPLHPQRRSAFSLFPASLLSLPRSHHSCSQAPSLAATVSPPPPSELHCECLVQQPQPLLQYAALPCLFTVQPEPNAAHTASPFGLRGGEGKHFKLQIQPGKQGSGTDSWAHPHRLCESECSLTSIDLFLHSWNTLIPSASSSASSVVSLSPLDFALGKQEAC